MADRLAGRRAQSRRRHAVHPVAGARARRAAPAAVDDHAARLARARAQLQGPAGAARRTGPRHLRLPRLSAAAERRHPAVPAAVRAGGRGPGRARRDHARDRAALQPHLRPRAGIRDRRPKRPSRAWARATRAMYRTLRKEFQEKGDADALARARALVESNARLTVADRDRLLGFLEGTGISDPARARRAAHRDPEGAGPRRPQDVEVLRQHHRPARGHRFRSSRSSRPCRPTRRACGAPIPAIRTNARCGTCTRSTRAPRRRPWVQQGCRTRRHRLPGVQDAADREGGRGDRGDRASGRRSSRRIRSWYAVSSPRACERARAAARDTLDAVRQAMAMNYR